MKKVILLSLVLALTLLFYSCCDGHAQRWIDEDTAFVGEEMMKDVGPITITHEFDFKLLGWTFHDPDKKSPIFIRCRHSWERLLFPSKVERLVVIHEICHSWQLNTFGVTSEDLAWICVECLLTE